MAIGNLLSQLGQWLGRVPANTPTLSSMRRWVPVLLIGALWAAHAAWFYWVCDDAFISFRYARQFLDGHGLVFNPGERVEGYTNLLWVLEVALLGAVGIPMPLASVILSALCSLGCVLLVIQLLRSTPFTSMRRLAVGSALLLLAVNRNVAVWTTSGLETRQFTFLVLLSIWLVRRSIDRQSGWLGAALALGATELTRPEGGLVAVSITAWVLWHTLTERRAWRRPLFELAAPTAIIIIAHYVWRHAYYDDWLPNTAYAKVVRPWPDAGLLYFGAAFVQAGLYLSLPLALVGGCLRWLRRRDGLLGLSLAAILPHAVYVIAIGGDHFEFRPLDYYWPLLAVAAGDALGGLALWIRVRFRRAGAWQARGTSVLAWSAVVALLLAYSSIVQVAQLVAEYPRRSKRDLAPEPPPQVTLAGFPPGQLLPGFETLVRAYQGSLDTLAAHAIAVSWVEHRAFQATLSRLYQGYGRERAAFPEGAVMVHNWMGIIPYYLPEVTFIDRFGLTDKTIARHGSPENARRHMAHDRSPPPGYLESRGVNITIEPAARRLDEALLLAPYAMELAPDVWAPFSTEHPELLLTTPRPPRWYHLDWQRPERSVVAGQRVRSARLLLDCESEPKGWMLSGARCQRRRGKGEGPVAQAVGTAWLSTYDPKHGDAATADVRSPGFTGGSNTLLMLKLGGGAGNGVRVALCDASGRELASFRGANDQTLRAVIVDLRPYDRELHLELIDAERGSWGHLLLDAVALLQLDSLPNALTAVSGPNAPR